MAQISVHSTDFSTYQNVQALKRPSKQLDYYCNNVNGSLNFSLEHHKMWEIKSHICPTRYDDLENCSKAGLLIPYFLTYLVSSF